MAEKPEKKPDAPPPTAPPRKKDAEKRPGRLMSKTPVLLGMVMVIEAGVLFAGFKFLGGGPKAATAVELEQERRRRGEPKGDGHGEAVTGGDKKTRQGYDRRAQRRRFQGPQHAERPPLSLRRQRVRQRQGRVREPR